MFSIFKLKNSRGVYLDLTRQDKYIVTNVTGLNPVQAELVQNTPAYLDGAIVTRQRLTQRNIVIYLTLRQPVGENRAQLYEFLQTNEKVRVEIQKEREPVQIEGIAETIEADIFEKQCTAMISVLCPDPYFYSKNVEKFVSGGAIYNSIGFPIEFPIAFSERENKDYRIQIDAGSTSCGIEAKFTFYAPAEHFYIENTTTQEHMDFDTIFEANDVLDVCTIPGKKKAQYKRGSATFNILNEVESFIMLRPGINILKCGSSSEYDHLIVREIVIRKRYGALT